MGYGKISAVPRWSCPGSAKHSNACSVHNLVTSSLATQLCVPRHVAAAALDLPGGLVGEWVAACRMLKAC